MNRMILKKLIAVLAAGSLGACASQPDYAPLRAVPPGSTLSFVATDENLQMPDALGGGESVGKKALSTAGAGAGAGIAVGLRESAECGAYVLVCAPFFALFGAGAGAVVGGVGGSVGGAVIALPGDKARQLEAIVANYFEAEGAAARLDHEFRVQGSGNWMLVEANGRVGVQFVVEEIRFDQFAGDEVQLTMVNSMVVDYGIDEPAATRRIPLRFATERMHVDHWIANDGQNLRLAITDGFSDTVLQAVTILN